ncbi:uncharacterized protein LOC107646414 [Arachis ipaensis]|uniref:uncharacterized protein LOC107646414 n=1 Tax=Arachis ipaensis TaxID=130454 RepID=UPI0007AF5E73|nr:uncharacterized protein LOC107646414 [Arachis ipaensis]
MDAYSGYNQILMHPEGQSKTKFITEHGNFCYRVMPFGLKNAGATYQRMMDKVCRRQIGRNMKIYVDDMVAKTTQEKSHCDDLREIFEQIRAYNMRLNPEKCAFGVQGGKFLGFMLTSRGIEENPEKCEAILNMASPRTIKEVQQLVGKVAALSRFLPAASSRSYHFFQTISKNKKFQWTEECEKAFAELKTILSSPPVLQRPEVELAGCLTKWFIKLSEFDIQFQPRPALKAQILADFISELTPDEHNKLWELHVDGASSRGGSRAGIILKEGDKVVAEQSLQFHFPASNNQAEYEALIAGLKLALNLQVQILTAHCDSLLVVQQTRGKFQVKDPLLERYWLIAKDLISKFSSFIILHVHREKNVRADILSKLAATRVDTQTSALSQLTLKKPSIELLSITSINHLRDWRTPFLEYINAGIVARDELNPQHFKRKASLYTNIAGELYRRGFSQPLLKCLNKDEVKEVMDEVHEGVCGNHFGGRALAAKIVRTGYYWPTMKRYYITKVKTCDKCQKHAAISTKPAEVLHSMEVSWPFHRWGLDILGPFPIALGQVKFLLVSIDYFSKWIEAQPLARIIAEKVRSFIWKKIICRFGIPRKIISDNGRQFTDNKLGSFLKNFNIQHHFSSVEHPQTNGQAEAANRVILQAIKKSSIMQRENGPS